MPNNKLDRAKIFLPFDSLRGFRQALKERERIVSPQIELAEDYVSLLQETFQKLRPGLLVTVIYYDQNDYVKIHGVISEISIPQKTITIAKTKLDLKTIYDLKILNEEF
ncbi:MAG: hypothetical protein LBR37_04230 [Erysipelotrichaceae bacterium]|jgi:hypothetical protein|nr:hypothetical protein [Erysipelotrichaceae bacterium]